MLIAPTAEIPHAAGLRSLREDLGLSQSELADTLGFAAGKGPQTIRDWEHGYRAGSPFRPTPTAWAAFRYLILVSHLYRALPSGTQRVKIAALLPDVLR